MRNVILFDNLTLDGVLQAPAEVDEDPRDGFPYGGWGAPYQAMNYAHMACMANVGPLLFGRRNYEHFYAVWPRRTDSPFSEVLNNAQKYVASTTLKEPLPWMNSVLLKGDAVEAIAALKEQPGKDFLMMGSGIFAQSLMRHNLIDFYVLLIHPLVLGTGHKLFPEGSPHMTFILEESATTPNGVLMAAYRPARAAG